jgi:hypothetical protein
MHLLNKLRESRGKRHDLLVPANHQQPASKEAILPHCSKIMRCGSPELRRRRKCLLRRRIEHGGGLSHRKYIHWEGAADFWIS